MKEYNSNNQVQQYCKEDVKKQCISMPKDVAYLHTSCVYDPSILSSLEDKDVPFSTFK